MLSLLTMFGPLRAAKFWIAVVMAIVQFIQLYFDIDIGLNQEIVSGLIAGVTALFVWLVPNKKKEPTDYFPPKPGLY